MKIIRRTISRFAGKGKYNAAPQRNLDKGLALGLIPVINRKIFRIALRCLLLIFLLHSHSNLIAAFSTIDDDKKIDSLLVLLQNAKEDTNKINVLYQISYEYRQTDPQKGIIYGEQGLELAQKLGWNKGKCLMYRVTGEDYCQNSNPKKAESLYLEAIDIATKSGLVFELALCQFDLGDANNDLSDYQKSIDFYLNALKVFENRGDKIRKAKTYNNMGMDYISLADYPKALDYMLMALKLFEELNKKNLIANVSNNLGILYDEVQNLDKSTEYYQLALKTYEELNLVSDESGTLCNIGTNYIQKDDYETALSYLQRALVISKQYDLKNWMAIQMENIGEVYKYQKNYTKAIEYEEQTMKIAKEIDDKSTYASSLRITGDIYYSMVNEKTVKDTTGNYLNLHKSANYLNNALQLYIESGENYFIWNIYSMLYKTYTLLADYKTALKYYIKFKDLKDSVLSDENQKKIAQLDAKRENEVKQKEIEILQQKNQIQNLDLIRQNQFMDLLKSRQILQKMELQKNEKDLSILQQEKIITSMDLKQKNLETEKKNKELIILNREKKYQSMLSRSLIGGLFLTLAILGLLFMFFQRKRRDNRILAEKNIVIEQNNAVIQSDINQAKDYVLSLLPAKISDGRVRSDWIFRPCSQLGGDSFGYHMIDDDHDAFFIIDVCGHGIGPALHSVAVMHFLRSGSQMNVDPCKPGPVMEALNESFQSDDHNGMFFTMWYGVYQHSTRILNYVCAGHPAPFMLHENGNISLLDPPSLAVGCMPGITYRVHQAEIPGTASLYLFSDGVYEIQKPDGNVLLVNEFYDIIKDAAVTGKRLGQVFDLLAQIQNSTEFDDDFTIVEIRIEN